MVASCSSTNQNVALISPEKILADVTYLASDEMQGRHFLSAEAKHAAKHIATRWKDADWKPLASRSSMYIPIGIPNAAPNVVAQWTGNQDSYIILIAHYDHLKPKRTGEDRIFNGADDNASGTAALIAIAEAFQQLQPKLKSNVVLIASSGEEAGLLGAEHFVLEEIIPIDKIKAVINLDMISRGEPNTIFLEGSPDAPRISVAIHNANKKVGLQIIRDKHPDWMYRGDQLPFWRSGIPSVFLSVEDHEDYHKTSDHADKIMPDLAAKTAELALWTVIDLAKQQVPKP